MNVIFVAAGGAVGAVLRYGVGYAAASVAGGTFPLGTFLVNAGGSFFLGILAGVAELTPLSSATRLLLMTGFLGAFTTFSTFSLDTVNLVRAGHVPLAAMNVLLNVALSLAALVAGLLVSRLLATSGVL